MSASIVILGGGTGGTLMANRLRKVYDADTTITVVDRDDQHVYQPGLLFVPFGLADDEEITRSRNRQLHKGIDFHQTEVDRVDVESDEVHLADGTVLPYSVLVVATGARLVPDETEGLLDGWNENVFTFYTPEGAAALHDALDAFEGGRIVINIVDMPIKCPVAPLEFAFLADWFFHERHMRDQVEITFVTPLDGAFTKPVASATLSGLLDEKRIELVTEFCTGEVDSAGGRLISFDEREVPFDLLVTVPAHNGAEYVSRSPGLGDALDFIPVDHNTLQSSVKPNIFAIGDAAGVPASKAGSVTHFEGETLTNNIQHFLAGEQLDATYDGHANCFIETGFHKALLIDFDYDTEPLPGKFPSSTVGPLPLMKESRFNHLGKLMFQWFYWHALLKGREIPGIPSEFHSHEKEHSS